MKRILFNQQGEEAILAGLKWITRRPIKIEIHKFKNNLVTWFATSGESHTATVDAFIKGFCKYQIGETVELTKPDGTLFATAIIKDLRVEKLQDISEEDCFKEGTPFSINEGRFKCVLTGNPANDYHIPMKSFFRDRVWQPLPYKPPYDWDSNPTSG